MNSEFWAILTSGLQPIDSWRRAIVVIIAALAVTACAGPSRPVPESIRVVPPGNLQLAEVTADVPRHTGRTVRWGGEIMAVERQPSGHMVVEILSRRLEEAGRPYPGGPSDGRFQIHATAQVDPALYAEASLVTVVGTIAGQGTTLGRSDHLPVVAVSDIMNWGPVWYSDPYYDYYDPYYGPYYGPRWHRRHRIHLGIGYGLHRRHGHLAFGHHYPFW